MSDDEVKDTQDGDDRRIDKHSRKHSNDSTRFALIRDITDIRTWLNATAGGSGESLRIMRPRARLLFGSVGIV
ncbi:hypothetical protein QQF64_006334 [Cirrhinus molitorella]|uniref:Uncharacterized protein n=1 Tax=Cirrhinus molitorella TaxID=172907 RepID=A0ABR3MF68_9TELE